MKIERFNENLHERPTTYELRRKDNDELIMPDINDAEKIIRLITLCKRRDIDFYILKYTAEIITEEQLNMEHNTNKFNI